MVAKEAAAIVRHRPPATVLAEAADVLSDQLRTHLRRLASVLQPHAAAMDRRFARQLRRRHLGPRERHALLSITPGAVAQALSQGESSFFGQVEYHGRRLAKLNLPPSQVLTALEEYDRLLIPLLERRFPEEHANFRWVREQLHFCVILTLNNAYYQVREAETQAFYELFRVELESRSLDQLLNRFLAILAQFCHADAAHIYLVEPGSSAWQRRAVVGEGHGASGPALVHGLRDPRLKRLLSRARCWSWTTGESTPNPVLLHPGWARRFASCWSIPLSQGQQISGVMQFGFRKFYEWLPREQDLLTAAAERCLMAAEKARLVEDLAQREEQIRLLAERMLHVEEAERRRISRELHDEAGQSLLTVRLQLEMIEQSLPADATARLRLAEVREMTEGTILEIRRLIAALSPAVLEQLGLGAALRQLVSRFRQMHPARVKLQLARLQGLPKRVEIIVYRLVQECCNNIAKHSLASNVNISASTADGMLKLLVEDDGVGFAVEEALQKNSSFGIAGIRERVALMGGRFEIESEPTGASPAGKRVRSGSDTSSPATELRPKRGTRIRIQLPIGGHELRKAKSN